MKKRKIKFLLLSICTLFFNSCSIFIKNFDNKSYEVINRTGKDLSLVFSHNINGETNPCGCRHFPLGGLPQVAGQLSEIRKSNNLIYVDTGDLLFPSSVIPISLKKSLDYTADVLVDSMNKLGLDYFVPGDQDFASGLQKIQSIANNANFKFLIANLKNPKLIKHKKWVQINNGPSKIFLIGVVEPSTLNKAYQSYFSSPIKAIRESIQEMKKIGFDSNNNFHRLIILSHSGIDYDEVLAKKIPRIDWIIGAHSQSFTRESIEIKKTKLVQVLSRNHYLGEITIHFSKSRSSDSYKLLEMREGMSLKLSPNPFNLIIDQHKQRLSKIRDTQDDQLSYSSTDNDYTIPTASSCIECHQKQGNFWQGTPHSLAYSTLIRAKEENNQQCISCHSVGYKKNNGFFRPKDIIHFSNQKKLKPNKLRILQKKYNLRIKKIMKDVISVRRLNSKQIIKKSKMILALDEKLNIDINFSNVQCLNCHGKNIDHPFETNTPIISNKIRFQKIKSNCLSCHTKDQSISWYKLNKKGLPEILNELKFFENYKRMACPKRIQ